MYNSLQVVAMFVLYFLQNIPLHIRALATRFVWLGGTPLFYVLMIHKDKLIERLNGFRLFKREDNTVYSISI